MLSTREFWEGFHEQNAKVHAHREWYIPSEDIVTLSRELIHAGRCHRCQTKHPSVLQIGCGDSELTFMLADGGVSGVSDSQQEHSSHTADVGDDDPTGSNTSCDSADASHGSEKRASACDPSVPCMDRRVSDDSSSGRDDRNAGSSTSGDDVVGKPRGLCCFCNMDFSEKVINAMIKLHSAQSDENKNSDSTDLTAEGKVDVSALEAHECSGLTFVAGDVMHLSEHPQASRFFPPAGYDCVFDKGTMDCVCLHGKQAMDSNSQSYNSPQNETNQQPENSPDSQFARWLVEDMCGLGVTAESLRVDQQALGRMMAQIYRVLRPGGRFVCFSLFSLEERALFFENVWWRRAKSVADATPDKDTSSDSNKEHSHRGTAQDSQDCENKAEDCENKAQDCENKAQDGEAQSSKDTSELAEGSHIPGVCCERHASSKSGCLCSHCACTSLLSGKNDMRIGRLYSYLQRRWQTERNKSGSSDEGGDGSGSVGDADGESGGNHGCSPEESKADSALCPTLEACFLSDAAFYSSDTGKANDDCSEPGNNNQNCVAGAVVEDKRSTTAHQDRRVSSSDGESSRPSKEGTGEDVTADPMDCKWFIQYYTVPFSPLEDPSQSLVYLYVFTKL